jgi:hypothetical protein
MPVFRSLANTITGKSCSEEPEYQKTSYPKILSTIAQNERRQTDLIIKHSDL